MSKPFKQCLKWCGAGLMLAMAGLSVAQSPANFPGKPMRIVLPFPPGGAGDFLARSLGDRFAQQMGQPGVVDNKPGGDGIIGTQAVATAAPDGHTMLITTDSFMVNHWVHKDLPYDSLKDFAIVTPLVRSEFVLAVPTSFPAATIKDLVAYAKSNPGKVNAGVASLAGHLSTQRFMNAGGVQFTIVNYKGTAPAMTDLIAGTIQFSLFSVLGAQGTVAGGKMRGLAVSGERRDPSLPEVPTLAEAGIPGTDLAGPLQFPLLVPARTQQDIIQKLNVAVRTALADPEMVLALAKRGLAPVPRAVQESRQLLAAEMDRYGKLVKDAGLKME